MEERKCQFLYDMDLFGKTPELYYKRKQKRSTELGIVLTIIYIIIYITFLIYKLVRMAKRMDVTFYDTYAYKDFPYVNITNEEFYGAFAMGYEINEQFYYPRAQFVYKVKKDSGFVTERIDELGIEHCKLEKFGSRYKELFKDKDLDKFYCLEKVNGTFEGYSHLDRFSYLSVQFFPCINKTKDGRDCMPRPYMEQFFKKNIIEFKMQDNLFSPEIYDKPVEALEKDINTPLFLNLYQEIYSYIQIVILETDDDITGLNFWAETKKEKYTKYDESFLIANPPDPTILDTGAALCDVTLQLSAKVLTTRRKYTTLLDVLGDVGGLMELLYTFFNLIASFFTEISYDKSLVNNLFSFNIDKKEISIKKIKERNKKAKDVKSIDPFSLENENEKNANEFRNKKVNLYQKQMNINSMMSSSNLNNLNDKIELKENVIKKGTKKVKRRRSTKKTQISYVENAINNQQAKNQNNQVNELNEIKNENINNQDIEIYGKKLEENNDYIITKIDLNIFCYCFLTKKRNVHVNLLDEGMKIITKRLDIMNLFLKIYQEEKLAEKIIDKFDNIPMSSQCKSYLDYIIKERENSSLK